MEYNKTLSLQTHPCFSDNACNYARLHLPVAPKCNVQCNYCNRKFDCANEARPGVTSKILQPDDIYTYVENIQRDFPLSTIGIAGPGDPMANWDIVRRSCEIIHDAFPSLNLCLSTNGLELEEHIDELSQLGVRFITITLNAIDMDISQRLYSHIIINNQPCSGSDACSYLYEKQLSALRHLKKTDIYVKINTVAIKGINDSQIQPIAKLASAYGCYIMNIIPMLPVQQTPFANIAPLSGDELAKLRVSASSHINIMTHCQRCRSDAFGYVRCKP